MEKQLADLRAQLEELEARYTPDHPEVTDIKRQIQLLQRKLQQTTESENQSNPSVGVSEETPEVAQLRASVQAIDEGLKAKSAEQIRLEQEIASYQARIQLSPLVEEQYKVLTRDYNSALQFYNDLLAKKTQSEMVRDLEQQREGEQFHVMDAPPLPSKPRSPDRVKFSLGGLASGFALGVLLTAILEFSKRLVRTEHDVSVYLQIPLLGIIQDLERTSKVNLESGNRAESKITISELTA